MAEIPTQVKVAVLRSAAASKYPQQALGSIAANHNLTLGQVKTVVETHGWPRPDSMLRAASILERKARRHDPDAAVDDADTYVEISMSLLNPDPQNIRDDLGDLTEMKDSMALLGLLQPVVARRHAGKLILVTGHRRYAAAQQMGWTEIPCLIKAGVHADDVLVAMLTENTQRKQLDPIEEARALRTMKDRDGLTDAQLAVKVARSQMHVSNRLALLDLTPAQQDAVRAGSMSLANGANAGRKLSGRHRPTAVGKKSAAHLTSYHPLAPAVEQLCQQRGHSKHTPGRVGGIACGQCWEDIIRTDERQRLAADQRQAATR